MSRLRCTPKMGAAPRLLSLASFLVLALITSQGNAAESSKSGNRSRPKTENTTPPIPQSAVGPTSNEEADLLFQEARTKVARGENADAIPLLERFIARYPGSEGYVEAHRLLGIARLETGHAGDAVAPLRYYVGSFRPSASQAESRAKYDEGRLLLAQAQLASQHPSESALIAGELLSAKKLPPSMELRALLLQARSRIALNQRDRASLSLKSARGTLARLESNERLELEPWLIAAELQLRLLDCARFAVGTLDEAQALDQFERRGQCLEESLLAAHAAFATPIAAASRLAADALGEGFAAYFARADEPPPPPALKPKPRTAEQNRVYRAELSARLRERARARASSAVTTARVWITGTSGSPLPEPGLAALQTFLARLEKISK